MREQLLVGYNVDTQNFADKAANSQRIVSKITPLLVERPTIFMSEAKFNDPPLFFNEGRVCPSFEREIMLFIGKPKGRSRMISNST
jgi:hypothetical protein